MPSAARLSGPSTLALVGDASGSALWRVLQPVTALERLGYPCGWDRFSAPGIGRIGASARVVVLTRLSWPLAHRAEGALWFEISRRLGQTTVYELDDDLLTTAHTARGLRVEAEDGATISTLRAARDAHLWTLGQCDGVTVSTPYLADVVRRFTDRPVVVVPNAIDVPWFRSALGGRPDASGAVTIGWAGGRRDEADLAPVAAAWHRVAAAYPSVRFVVAGWRSSLLCAAVPAERLTFRPWVPIERYPSLLRGITIGCAAVEDEPFNRSKSPIKAYEYALAGAAVVGSPTVYGDAIEHGRTGRLAVTADDWTAALSAYAASEATRVIEARRLRRHVERHCALSENVWRWPAAWRAIAEHATARRGERVLA